MATSTLYFVQADTLPQIKLTLTDETANIPKDLTNKTVTIHARPAIGSGVSFSRQAIFPNGSFDRQAGLAYIQWQPGDLDRPPGEYLAEIEILDTVTNTKETVYDTIKLVIREDIS